MSRLLTSLHPACVRPHQAAQADAEAQAAALRRAEAARDAAEAKLREERAREGSFHQQHQAGHNKNMPYSSDRPSLLHPRVCTLLCSVRVTVMAV